MKEQGIIIESQTTMSTEVLDQITESPYDIGGKPKPDEPAILNKLWGKIDFGRLKKRAGSYLFPSQPEDQDNVYEVWTNGEIRRRAEKLPQAQPKPPQPAR